MSSCDGHRVKDGGGVHDRIHDHHVLLGLTRGALALKAIADVSASQHLQKPNWKFA
jgi:hypothetical protein